MYCTTGLIRCYQARCAVLSKSVKKGPMTHPALAGVKIQSWIVNEIHYPLPNIPISVNRNIIITDVI